MPAVELKDPNAIREAQMEKQAEEEWLPPFAEQYFTPEMIGKYRPLADAMKKVVDAEGKNEEANAAFKQHWDIFKNFEWLGNWDGKKYDIVFYGVSGYTGYLMMEYLKRTALKNKHQEKFTFAFAGRTVRKVEEMRDREFAGTEWADTPVLQASFDDIPSLINLAKSAHVLINVAGPYMLTAGDVLVDACIFLGTHYVDISGEIPWSLRLVTLHHHAKKHGVMVIPSAASAGGYPDLGVYLCAKELREKYGEEARFAKGLCNGGGAPATASGGTLKTRSAMNTAGDDVKRAMGDPFALGGFVPWVDRNGIKHCDIGKGTGEVTIKGRPEDLDAGLAKITHNEKLGVWQGPHVYAYFDTRIVRRSNALFADLADQPYGRRLNFMMHAWLPDDKAAELQKAKGSKAGVGVEEEKARLQAEGKYYAEGEGPPLEELSDAWCGWHAWVESEGGHETRCSFVGADGYYETTRMAIETAMCLRFDAAAGKLPFKGGCLTPTVAGGECLVRRIINSGMKFKMSEWLPESEWCTPAGIHGPVGSEKA